MSFQKKERKVVISLLVVFVFYCLFLLFYNPSAEQPVIRNLDDELAKLSGKTDSNTTLTGVMTNDNAEPGTAKELFVFDPNTIDEADFAKLGLSPKIVHTIINYRNKGGQFRKPEDIRKIYGLQKNEADKLVPFIQINSQTSNTYATNGEENKNEIAYHKAKPQLIDINTATVEQWKNLPAIGDALSNRIVKYRDKIGGFTSIEQVKQTYGLSDSAYQIILPYLTLSSGKTKAAATSNSSKKININTASVNELKSNLSIPPDVAEAIVIYRKQHGNFSSVEDIKKIVFINEAMYQQVAPHLSVN